MSPTELIRSARSGEPAPSGLRILGPRAEETHAELHGPSGMLRLELVPSPYRLARTRGSDLNAELRADPIAGGRRLDELCQMVQRAIEGSGDGMVYVLSGASPAECSPMQYGGHYLERDRDLLLSAVRDRFVVLGIADGEGAYLDCLSDLPADVFAWDPVATGQTVAEARAFRPRGWLATPDGIEADVAWTKFASLASWQVGGLLHA